MRVCVPVNFAHLFICCCRSSPQITYFVVSSLVIKNHVYKSSYNNYCGYKTDSYLQRF